MAMIQKSEEHVEDYKVIKGLDSQKSGAIARRLFVEVTGEGMADSRDRSGDKVISPSRGDTII